MPTAGVQRLSGHSAPSWPAHRYQGTLGWARAAAQGLGMIKIHQQSIFKRLLSRKICTPCALEPPCLSSPSSTQARNLGTPGTKLCLGHLRHFTSRSAATQAFPSCQHHPHCAAIGIRGSTMAAKTFAAGSMAIAAAVASALFFRGSPKISNTPFESLGPDTYRQRDFFQPEPQLPPYVYLAQQHTTPSSTLL